MNFARDYIALFKLYRRWNPLMVAMRAAWRGARNRHH